MPVMSQTIRIGDRASAAPRCPWTEGLVTEFQCVSDHRMPIHSDWAGSGQRPAGLTQNLNRAAGRLAGLDSDSDDGLGRALAGQGGHDPGGHDPGGDMIRGA